MDEAICKSVDDRLVWVGVLVFGGIGIEEQVI
jgi:hypothetical protein